MCNEKGKGQNNQLKQEPYGQSKGFLEGENESKKATGVSQTQYVFLDDVYVWQTAIIRR